MAVLECGYHCVVDTGSPVKVNKPLCLCRATQPTEGQTHEFKHRNRSRSSSRTVPLTRTCTPAARDSSVPVVSAALAAGAVSLAVLH
jgi:hypothetical protein